MKKYIVTGMSCAACSARVQNAVEKVDGVTSCSVNLLTKSMEVDGTAPYESIEKAVVDAGYGITTKDKVNLDDAAKAETKKLFTRFLVSVIFLVVLMLFSMGPFMHTMPAVINGIVQAVIAIVVMCINHKFFTNGFKSLFKGSPNMDTLVAVGSTASYLYSLYALYKIIVTGGMDYTLMHSEYHLYFEGAAMIVTLITIGKTLESYSKGKTTNAIQGLMKLIPETAVVIRDGKEVTININDVNVGDIFIVKPGENIPVDGEIIEGTASINEAAISGESIPLDKKAGDEVISATTNLNGFIKCKATKVGEDTTLANIINLVTESAGSKAPAQKIADKVALVFVPVVMGLALITFIVWMLLHKGFEASILHGVAVLVISCPCALGLATPVAIMVGNGVGAKNGVLFKTSRALEQTGKAKFVVLDKTGTITKGEPEVVKIETLEGADEKEIMSAALSLETKSTHPLALAIVNKARDMGLSEKPVENFEEKSGFGVSAKIDGDEYFCGRREGYSSIVVTKNGKICGKIFVEDEIKDDSIQAVADFKKAGMTVVMLTGDNRDTAAKIAEKVGIDRVIAEIRPDQKAAEVEKLKKEGEVIMIGDGINDAPALVTADTGIAIGAGSDIAIDSADVVLVNSSLLSGVSAVRLSRGVSRNIKENLAWAFCYNLIGIPLAAGCFESLLGWGLNPMFAAGAMSFSSFFVCMNALRLNRIKLQDKDNQ